MWRFSILILTIITLASLPLRATHLVGGEIYYQKIDSNRYVIGMTMYRDCNTSGFQAFDPSVFVAIYDAGADTLITVLTLYPSSAESEVPLFLTIPCLSDTPNVCIAMLEYSDTVVINVPPGGIHLSSQRCCRAFTALNILGQPEDFGTTYYNYIPDSATAFWNSSPRFDKVPPKVVCVDAYQNLDYSATDLDGDSLSYKFCSAYHGGGKSNGSGANSPQPAIPTPPPYDTLTWGTGFFTRYQIPSSPNLTIDSTTGIIRVRPDQVGTYIFAVCVQEYRDGVFLSENRRDYQITTTLCNIDAASAIDSALEECIGLEVHFFNMSTMGNVFIWDFGDSSTFGDTSSYFNPSYTYPDTGLYWITLVAYGDVCTDTAVMPYRVLPKIAPDFTPPTPDCLDRHAYDFTQAGFYKPTTTASWNFGFDSIIVEAGVESLSNIHFDSAGKFPVTLWYEDFGCLKHHTDTVLVLPNPDFHLIDPELNSCSPFQHHYSVSHRDASRPWFEWKLDSSSFATGLTSEVMLTTPGTYDLSITMRTDSGCIDTVIHEYPNYIVVSDTPQAIFNVSSLEVDLFEPYLSVFDSSIDAKSINYSIDDLFRTKLRDFNYEFSDTGNYVITQVAVHENGCEDSVRMQVRVKPPFLVFIPNSFTPDLDDENDLWLPMVFVSKEYDLKIYDRWGHIVQETDDSSAGWNGRTMNIGERNPIGVYYYNLSVRDEDLRQFNYAGSITLLR